MSISLKPNTQSLRANRRHRSITQQATLTGAVLLLLLVFAAASVQHRLHAYTEGSSAEPENHELPALNGDKAIAHLKKEGLYDSLAGAMRAATADFIQQQKLLAGDAAMNDQFGFSVAISGNTAVVGAIGKMNGFALSAGAAYVFVRNGAVWSQQQKLALTNPANDDGFGVAVSISGETLVVGASAKDIGNLVNAGAAYVYVRNGNVWSQQQQLTASDSVGNELLGGSVAISGETIVAGARKASHSNLNEPGAVYVFTRTGTTWSQQQKLIASDPFHTDELGTSVAISGDTIVACSPDKRNAPLNNAGAAYVYVRSGSLWSEQQKLTASDADMNDAFGTSVSISGETVIVGARGDDTPAGVDAGAAYVFVRNGALWSEQQKLSTSDGMAGDNFGHSVAISGDRAVICAPFDPPMNGNGVGAYVFERTGSLWTETQKLTRNDSTGFFANAVAISGGTIVVGASGDNAAATNAGAAYVFALACTNITCPSDITAVAAPSCPPSAGAVVSFPTPDGCPGSTVVCSPASGSMFPPGTTTVTCTATDNLGNTGSCSFTIRVFSGCLQDDANPGNVVFFNRATGEYSFCCGGIVLATGIGKVTGGGCSVTIEHNAADRKVLIKGDFSTNKGTALLQMPAGRTKCQITDRDTRNNSCQCGS
jgi:hypothetical protein